MENNTNENLIVDCWNITGNEGEKYIIDVFTDIINRNILDIRCDILANQMSNTAKKKNIKLLYNNRHRNLNFYMKNKWGSLTEFLENHKDVFIVYEKKKMSHIRLNEEWLDDEKWTIL